MTNKELAELALKVLDGQQRYFHHRTKENLVASKQDEARLRRAATAILNPQPPLFKPLGEFPDPEYPVNAGPELKAQIDAARKRS